VGAEQIDADMRVQLERITELVKFTDIHPAFTLFDFSNPGMRDLEPGGQIAHGEPALKAGGFEPLDQ
jgi:hypothetical protein